MWAATIMTALASMLVLAGVRACEKARAFSVEVEAQQSFPWFKSKR